MPSSWPTGSKRVFGATVATVWSYLYNLGFDRLLRWAAGTVQKTVPIRIARAILFEAALLVLLLPLFALWLGITLLEALMMDLSFATFYAAHAFVFTWAYDALFPPDGRRIAEGVAGGR